MKPLFPTYIIKEHAKRSMRGKFLKTLGVTMVPVLIVGVIALIMLSFVPGATESFEIVLTGRLTDEARMEQFTAIMENYTMAMNALLVLFAFLTVGSARACLDIVRGKELKLKTIFCFYGKWYIAALYPLFTFIISYGSTALVNTAMAAKMNETAVMVVTMVFDILVMIIMMKLIFIDYALADMNCENILKAVHFAWQITGFNTIMNVIILAISFIGWFLLAALTGGIVLIYVVPYIYVSIAALYDANIRFYKGMAQNNDETDKIEQEKNETE